MDKINLASKERRSLFGTKQNFQKVKQNGSQEVQVMISNHGVALDWASRKKSASTDGSMKSTKVNSNGKVLTKLLVKDVFSALKTALKGANLWDSLDYFEISKAMQKRQDASFPSFEWLSCAPVTSGGNHYVYIGTIFKGRHNLMFVGKTSKGFDRVCEVANKCARELGA